MAEALGLKGNDIDCILSKDIDLSIKSWHNVFWWVKSGRHVGYGEFVITTPTSTKVVNHNHNDPKEIDTLATYIEGDDTSFMLT